MSDCSPGAWAKEKASGVRESSPLDGNLLTATDNAGAYNMSYDADNRLTMQTDPFGLTLSYSHDANGNVISVLDSQGGIAASVYDADNRLTSQQFINPITQLRIDFTYDGNGNMLTQTRYSDEAGTTKVGFTQNTFDADNRETSIQHQDGSGSVLATYTYTYDAGSRLLSQTINGATTNYAYDAINELTQDGAQKRGHSELSAANPECPLNVPVFPHNFSNSKSITQQPRACGVMPRQCERTPASRQPDSSRASARYGRRLNSLLS